MADQLPTGDTLSSTLVRYRFYIPDDLWLKNAFYGEVLDAIESIAWIQEGAVTPDEAAYAMLQIWETIMPDWLQIGTIIPFAGSSSPDPSLLLCNGASLAIADYPQLYDVIGTTYGGTGGTHFNVPDLRGRTVIGTGTGSGLTPRSLGDSVGEELHTLTEAELASHTHTDTGHVHSVGNTLPGLALAPGEEPVLVPNPIPTVTGNAAANLTSTGGDEGHNTMQPSIALTYLIVAK
jgi:microcystin-dependent protein